MLEPNLNLAGSIYLPISQCPQHILEDVLARRFQFNSVVYGVDESCIVHCVRPPDPDLAACALANPKKNTGTPLDGGLNEPSIREEARRTRLDSTNKHGTDKPVRFMCLTRIAFLDEGRWPRYLRWRRWNPQGTREVTFRMLCWDTLACARVFRNAVLLWWYGDTPSPLTRYSSATCRSCMGDMPMKTKPDGGGRFAHMCRARMSFLAFCAWKWYTHDSSLNPRVCRSLRKTTITRRPAPI